MKIGIYGSIDVGEVKDKNIDYIAVEQGTFHLLNQGLAPVIVIGDMDSIEDDSILEKFQIERYSPIKDETDIALAIQYAIENNYDVIDLYGVTKKRMDHFMAVISLLEHYQNIKITIYDEYNKIYILQKGKHTIHKDGYHYFSIFAFDKTILTIQNAHYNLDHYLLKRSNPLCVSNQMNDDHVIIENSETILMIQAMK
ncbi:MAG: thiamine diphosphokinase [Erysipelotrichaceae bacterium]|nr:thiamine diphosphokinase [Erysipelotrichaceae bacterium]